MGSDLTSSRLIIIAYQTSSSTIPKVETKYLVTNKGGYLVVVELVNRDLIFAQPAEVLFAQWNVHGDTHLCKLFICESLLVNLPYKQYDKTASILLRHFLRT